MRAEAEKIKGDGPISGMEKGAAGHEIGVLEPRFSIGKLVPLQGAHGSACEAQDGVAGGGVPFHGAAHARVEVGLAGGDAAP